MYMYTWMHLHIERIRLGGTIAHVPPNLGCWWDSWYHVQAALAVVFVSTPTWIQACYATRCVLATSSSQKTASSFPSAIWLPLTCYWNLGQLPPIHQRTRHQLPLNSMKFHQLKLQLQPNCKFCSILDVRTISKGVYISQSKYDVLLF